MVGRLARAVSLVGCAACAQILGVTDVPPDADASLNDADSAASGDSDASDAIVNRCDPKQPFGTPVLIQDLVSSGVANSHFRLTSDELTGVFQADNVISQVERQDTGSPWKTKHGVGPSGASAPAISTNGLLLYYVSGKQILQTTRLSLTDAFTTGMPLDATVNDPAFANAAVFITAATTELFIARSASEGSTTLDVVVASSASQTWQAPVTIPTIDGPSTNETEPVLSPNGLVIYFSSDAGRPSRDIFRATRVNTTSSFSALGLVPNVSADQAIDEPSWVSDDDCVLYFTSNRPSSDGQPSDAQIFVAQRGLD